MAVALHLTEQKEETMKRSSIVLIVAAFVLAVWWLHAPASPIMAGPGPRDTSPNVESIITQLELKWALAIVNKDAPALERLLAKEFNGTTPRGETYSREMAIQDLKNGVYDVTMMNLDQIDVNVFGNTAVAFTSQNEISKYGDQDFSGHYHYTDVWVKKNGRWQVVATHGSRFDEGESN
jgi:ketosteroid isomerase-like protein